MGRLSNKVAVITGGGSGIGARACLLFAHEGAHVTVVDRDEEAAFTIATRIVQEGGAAHAVRADVSNADDMRAAIDGIAAARGRIDILVNNAGYGIPGSVVETEVEDFDALMAVNVRGVFLGCKYAIPHMVRQGAGVIVNTASAVSTVGIRDRAAYVTSKGAVAAMTRAMALDHVDQGLRINAVAPGTIESPFFDEMFRTSPDAAALRAGLEGRQAMKRLGRPDEIANAMLFLASDESSFCTGTLLAVDGGWTAQ
ncbi:SDR family oxidoreductase [Roseixanthobacter liquoris]|uniref:SDR family oxidoreductase n=1 Tax=Roseixanthobacter liquoris TaxID=3119921 RepID=UPI00372AA2C7